MNKFDLGREFEKLSQRIQKLERKHRKRSARSPNMEEFLNQDWINTKGPQQEITKAKRNAVWEPPYKDGYVSTGTSTGSFFIRSHAEWTGELAECM